jgi:hypothetical protein
MADDVRGAQPAGKVEIGRDGCLVRAYLPHHSIAFWMTPAEAVAVASVAILASRQILDMDISASGVLADVAGSWDVLVSGRDLPDRATFRLWRRGDRLLVDLDVGRFAASFDGRGSRELAGLLLVYAVEIRGPGVAGGDGPATEFLVALLRRPDGASLRERMRQFLDRLPPGAGDAWKWPDGLDLLVREEIGRLRTDTSATRELASLLIEGGLARLDWCRIRDELRDGGGAGG